jgi:hypothetical protein
VAGVISRDTLEVLDGFNLNARGVKGFDHHVNLGETIMNLKELVDVRPSDYSI